MHPIPCAGALVLVAGSSCFKQAQHGCGPMAPPFADHWSNAHGHTRRSLVKEIGPHNPIHLLHPFLHPPQMMDTTWHCSAITLLPHQHHVAELCSHCCQSLWRSRHSPSSSCHDDLASYGITVMMQWHPCHSTHPLHGYTPGPRQSQPASQPLAMTGPSACIMIRRGKPSVQLMLHDLMAQRKQYFPRSQSHLPRCCTKTSLEPPAQPAPSLAPPWSGASRRCRQAGAGTGTCSSHQCIF